MAVMGIVDDRVGHHDLHPACLLPYVHGNIELEQQSEWDKKARVHGYGTAYTVSPGRDEKAVRYRYMKSYKLGATVTRLLFLVAFASSQLGGISPERVGSHLQPENSRSTQPNSQKNTVPTLLVLTFGVGLYDCLVSDASPSFAFRLGVGKHWNGLHLSGRFTYFLNTSATSSGGYDIRNGPFPKVQKGGQGAVSILYMYLDRAWSPYLGLDVGFSGSNVWSPHYRTPLGMHNALGSLEIGLSTQVFVGIELFRTTDWRIRWELGTQLPLYKNWAWVEGTYGDGWNAPTTNEGGIDEYMPFVYSLIELAAYVR